ncbi:MAG TPA: N-acetylmuramoyl-L-alanine amidase [Thermoanaerobaculia bacterium]
MLQQAVAENLEIIRGLPPRGIRPRSYRLRLWMRRAPLVLLPLTLAGSTYMMTNTPPPSGAVHAVPAAVLAPRRSVPQAQEAVHETERVTAAAFPLAVRRVVLDAGHGGVDPGATSAQILEKEITLDIGQRLQTLLERDGFEVVTTRDADRTIALRERARVANESRSDIFLSIHVNALIKHTEARGIETYYLGATNDPKLTQLAAAENTVSGYSIADMRGLLDGVYADARRDESLALADAVQKNLFGTLRKSDPGLENWGVKRAPFLVLVATDMPAVLAEVGCISNEKEAAMLRRPEYRQKIADALFLGIRGYAKKGSEKHG